MLPPESLCARLGDASLIDAHGSFRLRDLSAGTVLGSAPLHGANVLLRTSDQLSAALALIELDGVAARIVIAPPDLADEHIPGVIARAGINVLVTDGVEVPGLPSVRLTGLAERGGGRQATYPGTEWVLFTSGTTGAPKMVVHSLAALTSAIAPQPSPDKVVWGTFYDIRRYGGLQILLRALLGHASLVLSDARESTADFLARLGREGVTHLTGTPSHWRRALMSPAIAAISPRYVRLSGEIADQAVLDKLRLQFSEAAIGHAYASTEAGVGFEVTDGREGFPASYIGRPGRIEMKVENGALLIRSNGTASQYVSNTPEQSGSNGATLLADGFVDTGDIVEKREERYYFMGRRGGIINVGGLKIHPEEVEAVINRHPGVRISRVSGRRNPITGAIVVAEIVPSSTEQDSMALKLAVLESCRTALPAQKVPALLRVVPALEMTAGGKLARSHA